MHYPVHPIAISANRSVPCRPPHPLPGAQPPTDGPHGQGQGARLRPLRRPPPHAAVRSRPRRGGHGRCAAAALGGLQVGVWVCVKVFVCVCVCGVCAHACVSLDRKVVLPIPYALLIGDPIPDTEPHALPRCILMCIQNPIPTCIQNVCRNHRKNAQSICTDLHI